MGRHGATWGDMKFIMRISRLQLHLGQIQIGGSRWGGGGGEGGLIWLISRCTVSSN